MLSCCLAFSQEAEGSQWLFIPRVDVNPYIPVRGNSSGFDLGDTSIYTLFEGDFGGSSFSYSIEGHWMQDHWFANEPGELYKNTLRSDSYNWLDWAYVTYTLGRFDFSAGKMCTRVGAFEFDDYDFDSVCIMNSHFWNSHQQYQLGGQLGFTTDDESTNLTLQVNASPYSEHPFQDGYLGYDLSWQGSYGPYEGIASFQMLQFDKNSYARIFAIGNKLSFGDFYAGLDYSSRWLPGGSVFNSEASFIGSLAYEGEKFEVILKAGYEFNHNGTDVLWLEDYSDNQRFISAGARVNWYPLKDSRDLRVHAVAAVNSGDPYMYDGIAVNIGATYYLDLRKLFRRK